ncbi:penicillin-binding transpeptidase domain-containing protein [Alicyclobacillus contaminans]|uniref:penicillin-binding transpeptidase domain-containing protein n=1 Tax=Alicyclobacillus contaminans TaxID=392016 RepID=UPI0004023B95|nr:penicillin-binding transpeptidase domain-containing protein [Alicyclobacillus contaminans]
MEEQDDARTRRLPVLYGMVFLALSSLITRLGYLQIAHGADFRARATATRISKVPELPSRGWIYDANGVLLAYDQPSFIILYNQRAASSESPEHLARRLASGIGVAEKDLRVLLEQASKGPAATVDLVQNANIRQVSFIHEHQSEFPGIQVQVVPTRVYPYGDLAGHVLGYVGRQSGQERPLYARKNYNIRQWVGKDGVEKQYEAELQGQLGYRVQQTSSAGVPLETFGWQPAPVAGRTLQLTLNAALQARAQQIVQDTLREVAHEHHYHPTEAGVVLLKPNDGSILALVSYPYYNPAWFLSPQELRRHWNYLWDPKLTPTVNHVIQSRHPPGSTVKPVNLLAALHEGVVTPHTTIADPGFAMVGTYRANDDVRSGHGRVGPVEALKVSCDTFFYYVGMWLANWHDGPPAGQTVAHWLWRDHVRGLNALYLWEMRFGLGRRTGVDLPGELEGLFFHDDAVKQRAVPYSVQAAVAALRARGYFPNRSLLYDNAAAAIGQMQQFTVIELAQYVAALANGGRRVQPHVVRAIYPPGARPGQAQPLRQIQGRVMDEVRLPAAHWAVLRKGMYEVVNAPGGTAYAAFRGAPYAAAGKTGTAQVGPGRDDTSVFIAYAPAEKPEVAVAVVVPGGGSSYDTAVPMARRLLDTYFQLSHAPFFPPSQWLDDADVLRRWPGSSGGTPPVGIRSAGIPQP